MQYLWCFVVGGLICVIGQLLIDFTKLTPAKILVAYVVSGVVLTAVGVYEPLVKFAGAGATVPLTGFGYAIANGVKQEITNNGAMGILTGAISATSAGITAAMVFGIIAALFFKPRIKKA